MLCCKPGLNFSVVKQKVMADNRTPQTSRDAQNSQKPKDVLNAEQDPDSIQDPLKVQQDKQHEEEEASLEQQRKEAMTERD